MTQPAPIKEPIVQPNGYPTRAWIRWFQILATDVFTALTVNGLFRTTAGIAQKITVVTANYTVLATDNIVMCDTDGGGFTVTLPAIVQGTQYRICNTGTSSNNVTLTPNGTEKLFGVNASETIYDQEDFEINGDTENSQGWE